MDAEEQRLNALVRRVVQQVKQEMTPATASAPASAAPVVQQRGAAGDDGIFETVDQALAAATQAQRELMRLSLERRERMIAAMRRTAEEHAEALGRAAQTETGLGRWDDKRDKNLLALRKTPGTEDLPAVAWSGDHGLTLTELAPWGVIGAITPVTNPTSTIICNGIGMLAAGNAVVFNVHPNAKQVSAETVRLLNRAIVQAGGPANVLTSVREPTIESAQYLMRAPAVRLLVVTGGPGVVKVAMGSGKKAICAGPGNPPVVVDETADIDQAARDIVRGAAFDNNLICVLEKEVFVVDAVFDRLKAAMATHGAFELASWEMSRLARAIFLEQHEAPEESVVNKALVGRDAAVILKQIGKGVDDQIRLAFAEVPRDHPLVWTEQLMPVLPLVRVASANEAIDLAIAAEGGRRHTATMHSKNLDSLSRMAREVNASIFVKNGWALAGLGMNGEGFASFSIASPTGEGLTSARTFARLRRCTLVDSFRIV
jgi:acyl-CoA reductase-like NAD-dependent aldehyde dehydrogenase